MDQLREDAVLLARQGKVSQAIVSLEKYYKSAPENIALQSDLMVIYGWNNQHDAAIHVYEQAPDTDFPDYTLRSIINSYRALGKSTQALEVVNTLLASQPQAPELLLKKSQLLIDTENYDQALTTLEQLSDLHLKSDDLFRVKAYFYESQNNHLQALRQYQQLLSHNQDDQEGLRGSFNSLIQLGAPFGAWNYVKDQEQQYTNQEQARLLITQAALLLRWSSHAAQDTKVALGHSCQALTKQFQALALLAGAKNSAHLINHIEFDMVVTLKNLHLYTRSCALYEQLASAGEIPPYVVHAAAESYLAIRKPKQTIELLTKEPQNKPTDFPTQRTLFYAYVEAEQFDKAHTLIDTELEHTPPFKKYSDSNAQYKNDECLEKATLAAKARLYSDQLKQAWEQTAALSTNAPGNSWLNFDTGEVALARGWPRKANELFQVAYMLSPDNHAAQAGLASSAIALNKLDEAEATISALADQWPAELATKRLQNELYWAKRPELWTDIELSYSEGPEQSGDGLLATGELISAPVNNAVRLSLQTRYAWSELPEGEERLYRFGGGLETLGSTFSMLGLIHYNDSTVEEMGGLLKGTWTPDDYLTISFLGEIFSTATPLRALYYGIREDKLDASVAYRWDESQSIGLTLSSGWFTDNNERFESGATYTKRMVDIPYFDLDTGIELYGSTNSRDNTPYYNPEADFSLLGTIKAQHLLYRCYDHALVQELSGALGMYSQKNYSSGVVGKLRYDLRYNLNPMLEATLGGEYGQNRYDGENEPYYLLNLMLHAKF